MTPHVYSALFAACASAKAPLELQELVNEVFDHMQATMEASPGQLTGQRARYSVQLNGQHDCASASIMSIRLAASRITSRTESRITSPRRSWVIACNALMHYHAKIKAVSGARAVLAVLAHHSLQPDAITYNTLIAAHAAVGDLTGAVDLFSEMKRNGTGCFEAHKHNSIRMHCCR